MRRSRPEATHDSFARSGQGNGVITPTEVTREPRIHFIVGVRDLARAIRFYRADRGFPLSKASVE